MISEQSFSTVRSFTQVQTGVGWEWEGRREEGKEGAKAGKEKEKEKITLKLWQGESKNEKAEATVFLPRQLLPLQSYTCK